MLEQDQKTLWKTLLNQFSVDVLKGKEVIPESIEYYVISLIYALALEINHNTRDALREENIETACCDNLFKIGSTRGFIRKGRSFPSAIVKIHGKCGAQIPTQELSFKFNDTLLKATYGYSQGFGQKVQLDVNGVGYVLAEIEDYTKKNYDISANSKGEVVTNRKNINKECELVGSICPGRDEETCEEYRQRLLRSFQYHKDNKFDIVKRYVYDFPCLTDVKFIQNNLCCPVFDKNLHINKDYVYIMPIFGDRFEMGKIPDLILKLFQSWLFGDPMGMGTGQVPINFYGQVIQLYPSYFDVKIVLRHNKLYTSEILHIETAIKKYVDQLDNGGLINKAQIQEIIESITHKKLDMCIEFAMSKKSLIDSVIYSQDGSVVSAYCDTKLICDKVSFYDSEGNEL